MRERDRDCHRERENLNEHDDSRPAVCMQACVRY